jgi:hypothetical protein
LSAFAEPDPRRDLDLRLLALGLMLLLLLLCRFILLADERRAGCLLDYDGMGRTGAMHSGHWDMETTFFLFLIWLDDCSSEK